MKLPVSCFGWTPTSLDMKSFLYRLLDWAGDHYYGISTRGWLRREELGLAPECGSYTPTPYRGLHLVLGHLPSRLVRNGIFLDYGSGLGRALVVASRSFQFRRVIGVECSESLCRKATANLRAARVRNALVVCANAQEFEIPPGVTVFFVFNAFFGEILRTVLEKIAAYPHPFAIAVCNYENFEAATTGYTWLERTANGVIENVSWAVYLAT